MSVKNKKEDVENSIQEQIEDGEITEEELAEFMEKMENFDEDFVKELSGTEQFEVVPTIDDDGNVLTKKQYSLIKKECDKLGLKVVYRIDYDNRIVLFDPETMKTGVVTEGVH